MTNVRKALCRAYQTALNAASPVMPYREPQVLSSVRAVGGLLLSIRKSKVFIVTGKHLRSIGALSELEASLKKNAINYVIFDDTCANPTVSSVEEAFEMYRNTACDAIIAFGGGSCIDTAKALGARVAYPDKSLDKLKGLLKVKKHIPTLIAIPTTSGSGSEVTVTAVITEDKEHLKYTINSFSLIPKYAVLDPEVTLSQPPHLTATTGMDALCHAVEAYVGRSVDKKAKDKALQAVSLIFSNLETAYTDGGNRSARANMQRASYLAGQAFTHAYVGYIHAVAHTLGGKYGISHGLANAVLMPIVLEQYGESVYRKLHELAIAAGVAAEGDDEMLSAKLFIKAIKELNASLGIPDTLSGINVDDIPEMARLAEKEANPLYPVPIIMDEIELSTVYFRAMDKNDRKSISCS